MGEPHWPPRRGGRGGEVERRGEMRETPNSSDISSDNNIQRKQTISENVSDSNQVDNREVPLYADKTIEDRDREIEIEFEKERAEEKKQKRISNARKIEAEWIEKRKEKLKIEKQMMVDIEIEINAVETKKKNNRRKEKRS